MALILTSPEDISNAALGRIGYKRRIGSMYDGSEASKLALDSFGQTRDALLRSGDWGFAQRTVAGTPSGTPPVQWANQYAYPSDCLRLKALFASTYPANQNNPLPVNYRVGNATVGGNPVQVIWANISSAVLVYTAQVTNPVTWEPLFTETLIASLAHQFAAGLASPEVQKAEVQDEPTEMQLAMTKEG